MKELSIEYAAGFFDGEGSATMEFHPKERRLNARFDYYTLRVKISNTNLDILKAFQARWGGGVDLVKRTSPRHKQAYIWRIYSKASIPFLESILPYLRLKGDVVRLCLRLQSDYTYGGRNRIITPEAQTKRRSIYDSIKLLNHRGVNLGRAEMTEMKMAARA